MSKDKLDMLKNEGKIKLMIDSDWECWYILLSIIIFSLYVFLLFSSCCYGERVDNKCLSPHCKNCPGKILCVTKNNIDKTKELMDEYFPQNHRIVVIEGGLTRNGTILNSIQYMKNQGCEKDSVLVTHDASRIFVSEKLIEDSIKYAIEVGAASAAVPAIDVIFESKEKGKLTDIPLRKHLCHAQTPQSFNIDKFLEIYDDLSDDEIDKLDEAMMLFHLRGMDVKLFPGDPGNFKITRPFDITLAESIFKS